MYYDFAFSMCPGIGPVKFHTLCRHFGSTECAYNADERSLSAVIGPAHTRLLCDFRSSFDIQKEYDHIISKGIRIITRDASAYPKVFLQLSDPPIVMYIKGEFSKIDLNSSMMIGIVGTRKPTEYGLHVAHTFGCGLSEAGCVVVSGMALGIDAAAHRGALESHGGTVAILGCGVNIVYPPSNRQLYESILAKGGLIMSEFPPDKTVARGLFVSRNRLIASLAKGILVVEGLKDSGSLVTAKCALEQGKEVFATPAPITSIQSEAPNLLLKDGATLVTSPSDILAQFQIKYVNNDHEKIRERLCADEKRIFDLLRSQDMRPDEMARTASIEIQLVLSYISSMEISGVIKRNHSGSYSLV